MITLLISGLLWFALMFKVMEKTVPAIQEHFIGIGEKLIRMAYAVLGIILFSFVFCICTGIKFIYEALST